MKSLTGKLLIAMPGMGDPRFERSVILMCEYSEKGAMGLIINKPAEELALSALLKQLGIDVTVPRDDIILHIGGPVESGRGFVVHSADYADNSSTLMVTNSVGMTATLDILEDIANGRGPRRALLALGYSGWGPGQLEDEIQANGWLTCDATDELIFGRDGSTKWTDAMKTLGVDVLNLSPEAGRA